MKLSVPNPLASPRQASAFVQSYWQQRSAVISAAMKRGECHRLPTSQVLRLAGDEMTESRLIRHSGQHWQIEHGPFKRREIPMLKAKDWTILIQGVDLHLDAARELLERFRFIPDARLDDLMISIAGPGGGVGPHIDDYDVFLLQLKGRRQWQIAPPAGYSLQPDQPLKLIEGFRPCESHTLATGDLLYLPAGWAHHGIALEPCMTASIGFRAPTRGQFQSAWLQDMADHLLMNETANDPRYRDAAPTTSVRRQWQRNPAKIPRDMMSQLTNWLREWQASDQQLREFVGRYLSEPKPDVWFNRAAKPALAASFRQHGMVLDRKTRLLWYGQQCFINGESVRTTGDATGLIRALADQRYLSATDTVRLLDNKTAHDLLTEWHAAGWLHAAHP